MKKEALCRFVECDICRIFEGTALFRKENFKRHLNSKSHKLNEEFKTLSDKWNNEKDENVKSKLWKQLEEVSNKQQKVKKSKSLNTYWDLTEEERNTYVERHNNRYLNLDEMD